MIWLKSHWRRSLFNLFALLTLVYVLTQGSTGWDNTNTFDPGLESGKWAIRFLLASLTMTPLNTYFGWKSAIKLRKSAGLWAFGFGTVHVAFYIRESKFDWLTWPVPYFIALGIVGMGILCVLAATSNRMSIKWLGKNWKRLHRLVYLAGTVVVTHSLLATRMSKKLMFRDPQAENELKVYVAILCVLLVVRMPLVRQWLKQLPTQLKRTQKLPALPPQPGGAEWLPQIHGRESSVSIQPTFFIRNELPDETESSNPPVEIWPEEEEKVR